MTPKVPKVSQVGNGSSLLYPVFKIILGTVCLILGAEYAWAYCVLKAASFGILYVADTFTWLSAGAILFTEGLYSYLMILKKTDNEAEAEAPLI